MEALKRKKSLILIGNPGVGKSTILNHLIGDIKFASGASLGSGKTKGLQGYHEDPDYDFYDTPGLADVKLRATAAKDIRTALSKGGEFIIVFVLTLESGRVRESDLTTVTQVLKAAPEIGDKFSICINKIKPEIQELFENPDELATLEACIFVGAIPAVRNLFPLPFVPELDEKKDSIRPAEISFRKLIKELPSCELTKDECQEIKIQDFEETTIKLRAEIDSLLSNQENLEKKIQSMEKQLKGSKPLEKEMQKKSSGCLLI